MRLAFSAKLLKFPAVCTCCGGPQDRTFTAKATRTTGKRVVHHRTHSWDMPWCSSCAEHAAMARTATAVYAVLATLGVVIGLWIWADDHRLAGLGWGIALAALLGSLPIWYVLYRRAERRRKPACATLGSPVRFIGWDGTIQFFDCASRGYAVAFAAANSSKLINVSDELRQPILATGEAEEQQIQVAAPAVLPPRVVTSPPATVPPIPAPPPDDPVVRWLEKIERLKGTASRRAALERALQEIASVDERQKLVLEVSRLEVRAALDKADTLKTPAGKRRTLREALDRIRADTVPDELQAHEIEILEEALRQLDEPS
jgi:hypothetical protein